MMLIIKCPKLLHYLHNYDKLNHQISICWQFDSSVSSWEIGNEMEMKVVLLYLCCWRCSSFSTLCRPITGKKCKKAPPRKVHKAEREKLKRDHLNDFFVELGNMLGEHSYANILSFRCFRVHVCWIAVWCFWTAPCYVMLSDMSQSTSLRRGWAMFGLGWKKFREISLTTNLEY